MTRYCVEEKTRPARPAGRGGPMTDGPRDKDLKQIEEEGQDVRDVPEKDLPTGDPIRAYLKEIGAIPMLDPEEEARLAREVGAGMLVRKLLDGRPWTLEEVGAKYGVTRERIRQIELKALRKLRLPAKRRMLKDFLD